MLIQIRCNIQNWRCNLLKTANYSNIARPCRLAPSQIPQDARSDSAMGAPWSYRRISGAAAVNLRIQSGAFPEHAHSPPRPAGTPEAPHPAARLRWSGSRSHSDRPLIAARPVPAHAACAGSARRAPDDPVLRLLLAGLQPEQHIGIVHKTKASSSVRVCNGPCSRSNSRTAVPDRQAEAPPRPPHSAASSSARPASVSFRQCCSSSFVRLQCVCASGASCALQHPSALQAPALLFPRLQLRSGLPARHPLSAAPSSSPAGTIRRTAPPVRS